MSSWRVRAEGVEAVRAEGVARPCARAAGARGRSWRTLPNSRSAAHCSTENSPFHGFALGCRIPSRKSPSAYTWRFAGTDVGARSKLRFLSPAPAGWAARQASEGGRKAARRRT